VGLAVRHSLLVPLHLPSMVWKPLVGLPVDRHDLAGVDGALVDALRMAEQWADPNDDDTRDVLCDGLRRAFPPGSPIGCRARDSRTGTVVFEPLRFANRLAVAAAAEEQAAVLAAPQLSAFFRGLATVLPAPLFPLLTPAELESLVCGAPTIDVGLLQRVCEYEGAGVHASAPHVVHFWSCLEQFDQAQRSRFVNFVSARSRLPASADDFDMNFKIAEPKPSAKEDPDSHLPHSQTCFFTLSLPFYTSQEVCYERLLYAIDK